MIVASYKASGIFNHSVGIYFICQKNFKNFMDPFHGWGSTASMLQSHYQETVNFLPIKNSGTHLIDTGRMKGAFL